MSDANEFNLKYQELKRNKKNNCLIETNQEKSGKFNILKSSSTVRSPVFASSFKSPKDGLFSLPKIMRNEQKIEKQETKIKIDNDTKLILQQFSNSYLSRASYLSVDEHSLVLNESSINDQPKERVKNEICKLHSTYEPSSLISKKNHLVKCFKSKNKKEDQPEGEKFSSSTNFRHAFLKTIQKIVRQKTLSVEPDSKAHSPVKQNTSMNPIERMRTVVNLYKEEIIKNRKPLEEMEQEIIENTN